MAKRVLEPKVDEIEFVQKIRLGKRGVFSVFAKPRTLLRIKRIVTTAPCEKFCYLKGRVGNLLMWPNEPLCEVDAYGEHTPPSQFRIVSPIQLISFEVRYTGLVHRPPPPAEVLLTITLVGEVVPAGVTQQRRWIAQNK